MKSIVICPVFHIAALATLQHCDIMILDFNDGMSKAVDIGYTGLFSKFFFVKIQIVQWDFESNCRSTEAAVSPLSRFEIDYPKT